MFSQGPEERGPKLGLLSASLWSHADYSCYHAEEANRNHQPPYQSSSAPPATLLTRLYIVYKCFQSNAYFSTSLALHRGFQAYRPRDNSQTILHPL
jgi:hypothetical protein